MSGKVAGEIWGLKLTRPVRELMLAMANFADDRGDGVRPSVPRLSWMLGLSDRQVQRLIDQAKRTGVLVEVRPGGGRGLPAEYAIRAEKGDIKVSSFTAKSTGENGDTQTSPNKQRNGVKALSPLELKRVTSKCHPNEKINGDIVVSSFAENGDILPQERVTFSAENGDIFEPGFGGKGGDILGLKNPPSEFANGEREAQEEEPPPPPDGGSAVCSGQADALGKRTKRPPPDHRSEDAKRIWRRWPVKEDPEAFKRAWDKRKPGDAAIARMDELLDAFEGRTLSEEELTKVVGPAPFVNQQRWSWTVPFKGLKIHEIASRPRERPKTIEDVRREADEERRRQDTERRHRAQVEHQQAERCEKERIDAAIDALSGPDREWLEIEAFAKHEANPYRRGKPIDTVMGRGFMAQCRREIYCQRWEQGEGS